MVFRTTTTPIFWQWCFTVWRHHCSLNMWGELKMEWHQSVMETLDPATIKTGSWWLVVLTLSPVHRWDTPSRWPRWPAARSNSCWGTSTAPTPSTGRWRRTASCTSSAASSSIAKTQSIKRRSWEKVGPTGRWHLSLSITKAKRVTGQFGSAGKQLSGVKKHMESPDL